MTAPAGDTGPEPTRHKPFELFRGAEARDYGEHQIQSITDPSPAVLDAFAQFAGIADHGSTVKLVYARPGFSLTSVWFKSGYPLALHSHSGGCLYYIVAGSIRMGEDVLGAGDGFFVDHDVPYTYETGPDGVEVLEFRATDELDIRFRTKTAAGWDKIFARLSARQADWNEERRPSETPRRRRPRSTAPIAAPRARRKAEKSA